MDDNDLNDRRKALEMNKKLLKFCDELWVLRDVIMEGMIEKEKIEYFKKIKEEDKIR